MPNWHWLPGGCMGTRTCTRATTFIKSPTPQFSFNPPSFSRILILSLFPSFTACPSPLITLSHYTLTINYSVHGFFYSFSSNHLSIIIFFNHIPLLFHLLTLSCSEQDPLCHPLFIIPFSLVLIILFTPNMYRFDKTSLTEDRFLNPAKYPSFSSTLLDQIYRSIDEGEKKSGDMKLYPETMGKKQNRIYGKYSNRGLEEEEVATESLQRACMVEKWRDKKITEKIGTHGRQKPTEKDKKLRRDHDHESHDALFFTSTSSSSDSSCGGFSSSDTESMYGLRSRASCFAPPRPKPVRTGVSEKKERRHSTPFHEHSEVHMFDDYRHNPNTTTHDEGLIKSKSRALKIYNNLKKVKQPISPGGRLTNFLNSLFTPGNTKKSKSTASLGSYEDVNAERNSKSRQASASACSSASSFSRSCLSRTAPSSGQKLRDGAQRSVRFYPVSVIVDEDSRPCGHKFLYEQNDHNRMMPVSVPTAWKIGRSPPTYKKNDEEIKLEKSRRGEEAGRELLKEYLQNQKKGDFTLMDLPMRRNKDEDEEDDAASYSSSDLFELDHLAVMEKGRYCQELPVYETTHVGTNRAIANGLIM